VNDKSTSANRDPVVSIAGDASDSPASEPVANADPSQHVYQSDDAQFTSIPPAPNNLAFVRVVAGPDGHGIPTPMVDDDAMKENYGNLPEVGQAARDHENEHIRLARSINPNLFAQSSLDANIGRYLSIGAKGSRSEAASEWSAYMVEKTSLTNARNAMPDTIPREPTERSAFFDKVEILKQRVAHVASQLRNFRDKYNHATH